MRPLLLRRLRLPPSRPHPPLRLLEPGPQGFRLTSGSVSQPLFSAGLPSDPQRLLLHRRRPPRLATLRLRLSLSGSSMCGRIW